MKLVSIVCEIINFSNKQLKFIKQKLILFNRFFKTLLLHKLAPKLLVDCTPLVLCPQSGTLHSIIKTLKNKL